MVWSKFGSSYFFYKFAEGLQFSSPKCSRLFYSLFATCKATGTNPIDWLTAVLNKINIHPINKLEELLPK
jgi:hypothetical protein